MDSLAVGGSGTRLHTLVYQVEYAVPSLPTRFEPLWTSEIPGSVCSGLCVRSSCAAAQVSFRAVKGSTGICFKYPADTRSSSDWGRAACRACTDRLLGAG